MHFDLTPLYKSSIGFDRFASLLDSVAKFEANGQTYPPYNIERTGDDAYRITMAVAGFSENDLSIEVKEQTLTIAGAKSQDEGADYLHQGIAGRSFERRFNLADHVEIVGASLENGLLHVDLKREIPEAMKPRTIKIGKAKAAKTIESKAA